jgi:Tol biopolymer transport system component/DNA-binding winged helix-turn-helix (wHTH) protein
LKFHSKAFDVKMSNITPPIFRFDDFHVDVHERAVVHRGQPVPLTPKAFQTLVLLLRHHSKVVEKETFLDEVWADTFVEESTLAQNILTLRKTLARFGDAKEYIATVPRRGYQFVGDVEEVQPVQGDFLHAPQPNTNVSVDREVNTSPSIDSRDIPHRSRLAYSAPFRAALLVGLLLIVAVSVGYFASSSWSAKPSMAESLFKNSRIDTVVADSDLRNAVISPNGRYLAVVQIKDGVQSLYVRQIESGNTVEIVPQIRGKFIGAAFSPSSEHIYYSVNNDPAVQPSGSLHRVSVLGGASKEVLRGIDSPAAVSPDGARIAFVRRRPEEGGTSLIAADIDGSKEVILVSRDPDFGFTKHGVAWSPDGKLLSAPLLQAAAANTKAQVVVIDAASGAQKFVSNEDWISVGQTTWLSDGSGILAAAYGAKSPNVNDELWMVPYPNGKTRLIASGINADYGISLNKASNSLFAVESNKFACFLTAPVDNLFKNTHVLSTISDESLVPFGADWTSDGRIIYSASDGGNADIFAIREDGSERKQLTSDASAEISPKLSSDGRYLIFLSNRTGQMDVWRSDANGTNSVQLTSNGNVSDPTISPDGSTVFYLVKDARTSVGTLWRVSMDGTNSKRITNSETRSPRVAPDGKAIACYIHDPTNNRMKLALISPETGEVLRSLDTPSHDDIPFLDWSSSGDSVFVVLKRGKPSSLWRLPLNGSPEQLREWENDAIFRLAISRNGQRVFYEVGNQLNSVIEIKSLDAKPEGE